MARILLDHCVPRAFKKLLIDHEVATAYERGWSALKNGDLLLTCENAGFEFFITIDKNLLFQQRLSDKTLRIIVLVAKSNRLQDITPLLPSTLDAIESMLPGETKSINA